MLPAMRPPAGVGNPPEWRRPSRVSDGVVDALEVAPTTAVVNGESVLIAVMVRQTLGATLSPSPPAWEDFLDAVKRGEFD